MGLFFLAITFNTIISLHYECLTKKNLSINFSVLGIEHLIKNMTIFKSAFKAKDAVKRKDFKVHAIYLERMSC